MIRPGTLTTFHRPVIVQLGRVDRDRVISTTTEAAKMLLREWPATGEKHEAAMQICVEALKGRQTAGRVRSAFIDAAKEARIYLGEAA